MAGRIRTIKPEVLDDEVAAVRSDAAWRLWVSLWVLADDYGNVRAGGRYLAAQVWQDTTRDAETPLAELAACGMVKVYEREGQRYASIVGWEKQQRIDNRGKPRVPGPESSPRVSANLRESRRENVEPQRGSTEPGDVGAEAPVVPTTQGAREDPSDEAGASDSDELPSVSRRTSESLGEPPRVSGSCRSTSDHRSPITDHRSPITDLRAPTRESDPERVGEAAAESEPKLDSVPHREPDKPRPRHFHAGTVDEPWDAYVRAIEATIGRAFLVERHFHRDFAAALTTHAASVPAEELAAWVTERATRFATASKASVRYQGCAPIAFGRWMTADEPDGTFRKLDAASSGPAPYHEEWRPPAPSE